MIYTIDKSALLEEAFKIDNAQKATTFARRGLKATNKFNNKEKFGVGASLVAPAAGMVLGGGIGNSIHGDEGSDDEYDMTGAAIGTAAGLLASNPGLNAVGNVQSKQVSDRLGKHGLNLNSAQNHTLHKEAGKIRLDNLKS